MCEFGNNPNINNHDRDSTDPSFDGFFSAEAIEAAVRQASANTRRRISPSDKNNEGDDDDDGT
jgi:hypothetical protein